RAWTVQLERRVRSVRVHLSPLYDPTLRTRLPGAPQLGHGDVGQRIARMHDDTDPVIRDWNFHVLDACARARRHLFRRDRTRSVRDLSLAAAEFPEPAAGAAFADRHTGGPGGRLGER